MLPLAHLSELCPGLDWPAYFAALYAATTEPATVTHVLATAPQYLAAADAILAGLSDDVFLAYLQWHALSALAPSLTPTLQAIADRRVQVRAASAVRVWGVWGCAGSRVAILHPRLTGLCQIGRSERCHDLASLPPPDL